MKLLSTVFFAIFIFWALPSSGSTRLAFLEEYDAQNHLIQYEPGSRFGHSAMEIDGQWLQSYPDGGVQLISFSELQKRGHIAKMISIPQTVTKNQIEIYLNKPFDFSYTWSDDAFYCAELLAKILGIPPEPMQFNHAIWPPSYWSGPTSIEGKPGISPDKIYEYLTHQSPWQN